VPLLDDLGGGDDLLEEVDAHEFGDVEAAGARHAHGHGGGAERPPHVLDEDAELAPHVGVVAPVVGEDDLAVPENDRLHRRRTDVEAEGQLGTLHENYAPVTE